jgi:hypothetical protein
MRKKDASLWCWLAVMPLFGCAAGGPAVSQQAPSPAVTVADEREPFGRYPIAVAQPAAILVVLPGAGAFGSDPALWASQGFDIVTAPPAAFGELAAAEEAAFAQMLASARQLADAPIWLLGPSPEIEAALAALGPGGPGGEQVSGVVVTASGPTTAGVCSESFSYFDPGTGEKPQVKFSKSGNCPPGSGFGFGGPSIAPAPMARPGAPRLIEAEAAPGITSPAAQRAAVARLAGLIKAGPSS